MRGFVARVRGRAAPSGDTVCCMPGSPTRAPAIGVELRRITHSDSAVVPPEALNEVLAIAQGSEQALALALKHLEENLSAPPSEWRRIHGSLLLLRRLLGTSPPAHAPSVAGRSDSPDRQQEGELLIGRDWFEVKAQTVLTKLVDFELPEDPRVGVLVRRAATAVICAAEGCFPPHGLGSLDSPTRRRKRGSPAHGFAIQGSPSRLHHSAGTGEMPGSQGSVAVDGGDAGSGAYAPGEASGDEALSKEAAPCGQKPEAPTPTTIGHSDASSISSVSHGRGAHDPTVAGRAEVRKTQHASQPAPRCRCCSWLYASHAAADDDVNAGEGDALLVL